MFTFVKKLTSKPMRKLIERLIPTIFMVVISFGASAQNVQLHYDFGRNSVTTTVEMFRADNVGNTFFFVDLDYNPRVSGAYWENVNFASGRTARSTGCQFILSTMVD